MRAIFLLALFALLSASFENQAFAHEKAVGLYAFDGQSGDYPEGGVVVDRHGTIFGTTSVGGNGACNGGAGCGTVFSLSPPMHGSKSWTFNVLYEFQGGQDGNSPQAQLTLGPNGSVYGYSTGGTRGTVWQLLPGRDGRTWTFQILYVFSETSGGDLAGVYSPLILRNGSLYGIALGGTHTCGQYGCGLVFRLTQSGGTWKEKALFEFSGGSSGAYPSSIVGSRSGKSLYVSTTDGNGAVYAFSPADNGKWSETMLTTFGGGRDGSTPNSLVLGADGSLYGIANGGDKAGLAFQLVNDGSSWTRTNIANIAHRYYGPNSLAAGPNGTLIGVIAGDVDFFPGAVFALTPANKGGNWTYTELATFNRGPDRNPVNVVTGRGGHLYGVLNGGDSGFGALFKLR